MNLFASRTQSIFISRSAHQQHCSRQYKVTSTAFNDSTDRGAVAPVRQLQSGPSQNWPGAWRPYKAWFVRMVSKCCPLPGTDLAAPGARIADRGCRHGLCGNCGFESQKFHERSSVRSPAAATKAWRVCAAPAVTIWFMMPPLPQPEHQRCEADDLRS
jgi:hypothetical protein